MENKILEFLRSEEDERFVIFEVTQSAADIEKNIINLELSRIDKKYQDCIVLEREFPSGMFGRGFIFTPELTFEELKNMYESAALISYIEKKLQLKKVAITSESILDYCDKRKAQLLQDYDSVNSYRSPNMRDKKQKELKLQIENAIANGDKKQWLIELSVKSIDNYNLWENKIQYAGNDKSCWWSGKGCYQKSSSWFGNLQDSRQGLAIYFYRKADETNNTGYGEIHNDIEWTLSGRLWAVKDNNNCLQFFNNYYKFGEKSELLHVLGLDSPASVEVDDNIYINDHTVFYYDDDNDSLNTSFIMDNCENFFDDYCEEEEEELEEELTDSEILENFENEYYSAEEGNLLIPSEYEVNLIIARIQSGNVQVYYERFENFVDTYDIVFENKNLAFTTFWDSAFSSIIKFFDYVYHYNLEPAVGIVTNRQWNVRPWQDALVEILR